MTFSLSDQSSTYKSMTETRRRKNSRNVIAFSTNYSTLEETLFKVDYFDLISIMKASIFLSTIISTILVSAALAGECEGEII